MRLIKKLLCILFIQLLMINTSFQYLPLSNIAEAATQTLYIHKDGLGSLRDITDDTGNTIASYSYKAFGNIRTQTGTIDNTYKFTTREYDSESNLYYLRARYYAPDIGRFLSKDPLTWAPDDSRILRSRGELVNDIMKILKADPLYPGNPNLKERLSTLDDKILKSIMLQLGSTNPQLLHKYVYCGNNPVNYIDPSGEIVSAVVAGCVLLPIVVAILAARTYLLGKQGDAYVRGECGNIIGEMEVPGEP